MEAGAFGGNSPLTPQEIEQAIRLVPRISQRTELLEHVVVGVPLPGGERQGGLIERLSSLESFTKGIFFTVLAANVFGGAVVTALFLLIK